VGATVLARGTRDEAGEASSRRSTRRSAIGAFTGLEVM